MEMIKLGPHEGGEQGQEVADLIMTMKQQLSNGDEEMELQLIVTSWKELETSPKAKVYNLWVFCFTGQGAVECMVGLRIDSL